MYDSRFSVLLHHRKEIRYGGYRTLRHLLCTAATGNTNTASFFSSCSFACSSNVPLVESYFLPLRHARRGFGHIVREVDTHGFRGDIHVVRHKKAASTQRHVADALASDENIIFCGAYHTGKMTILKAIAEACEVQGKSVAYVSADPQRACRFNGLMLYHFLGLRYMNREELPSRDQLEGTLERHARLCESTYASCVPSLKTADVLILDAVDQIAPVVIESMDKVCRQLRGKQKEAFGGLRVFASADFWRLPVHPGSDTGGYIYQLDNWNELFPRQRLLDKIYGQSRQLTKLVHKAYHGQLTSEDIDELENRSMMGVDTERENETKVEEDDVDDKSASAAATAASSGNDKASNNNDWQYTRSRHSNDTNSAAGRSGDGRNVLLPHQGLISNVDSIMKFTSRFPKQPAVRVLPLRFSTLKRTEIGSYIVNMLLQSSFLRSFSLFDSLNLDVGAPVHLLLDAPSSFGVPAGTVGEVLQVKEHVLVVHFPSVHRTLEVPRMRVSVYHSFYPEIRYEIQQFPLFPRQCISPMNIITYQHTYQVHINCHRLADTNDLGNILARMRSFNDFTIERTRDFMRQDGVVHEPTRIYYQRIANCPLSTAAEQWCRNCKSYIPTAEFYSHWDQCIRQVRWCSECNTRIPLERLGPHQEKHQIVLCMDCGRAVEWRRWEGHRLTCPAMMREVSPENEFLPLRTRQLALEMGLDKRDLHTMRAFNRGLLPKSGKHCTSGNV